QLFDRSIAFHRDPSSQRIRTRARRSDAAWTFKAFCPCVRKVALARPFGGKPRGFALQVVDLFLPEFRIRTTHLSEAQHRTLLRSLRVFQLRIRRGQKLSCSALRLYLIPTQVCYIVDGPRVMHLLEYVKGFAA